MHYPFWDVPGLTAPMLIAVVATLHIFVSLYAVGGGLFLAVEVGHAYRTNDRAYLEYLRGHAKFFILVTMVWGSITGVGIWWTIGLASPLATEFLIRTFVFAWGAEYVFFLIEIVSAFVFWYGWGTLAPRVHLAILRIYAAAAWISLVIITPITSFMLNPGDWGGDVWRGLANPQALPQIIGRTGAALLLATLYVHLHAAFRAGAPVRDLVVSRAARPVYAGTALFVAGAGWWFAALPASARAAAIGAPVLNIFAAALAGSVAGVLAMMLAGLRRFPAWLSPGFAILLWGMGLVAVGAGEFIREAVRKPFVIYGEVYSHGVLPGELPGLRRNGWVNGGLWVRRWALRRFPQLANRTGAIRRDAIARLPAGSRRDLGEAIAMHHCGSCHATDGYMGFRQFLHGWTPELIGTLVRHPERVRFVMPPWSGTEAEAAALAAYLEGLAGSMPGKTHDGT
ncbi:MAG: cytochrome ubiquinol oxidase subunit I [Candidatus Coatesbacteria bacterium]